jgi:chloramphenicol-sensitive protein RarD
MSTVRAPLPLGIASSVGASVTFGAVYFITPLLSPMSAEGVWATRAVTAVPLVAVVLLLMRQFYAFTELASRIAARPVLALGVLICGLLLSAQLWLFAWAPMNGRALQTTLGYFLMPLVLVVVGRFLYKDRLRWWHWLAVALATIGVLFQVIHVGAISWETLLVALGYPLYFILRRAFGFAHTGGLLWEFVAVFPLAVFVLVFELVTNSSLPENPHLGWLAPLFGVSSIVGFWLFVLASKQLPTSIFGLLSYVEPALLVVASYLLGERIAPLDFITYGAIWLAILTLLVGGIVTLSRERTHRTRTP